MVCFAVGVEKRGLSELLAFAVHFSLTIICLQTLLRRSDDHGAATWGRGIAERIYAMSYYRYLNKLVK